ncbi:MAG TPA: hypothetical protein VFC19_12415 [Candidatus Limnocylindrales bacterium]|nr:hypothetical protein [Candidatus Limnocylindrales bacterium]
MSWSLFELGVVRAAGFGFPLADRLADPILLEHALASVCLATELRKAAQIHPDLHRVARGQPLPDNAPAPAEFVKRWNELCHRRDELASTLEDSYLRALSQARTHLDECLRDEKVRAALILLTPQILDTAVRALLRRAPAAAAPNQHERKAVAFVQRLAAKCETNGTAGPIGYALLGDSTISVPEKPHHQGFLAFWAVRELTRAWIAQADLTGRPRRLGARAAMLRRDSPAARYARAVATGRLNPDRDRLHELHRQDLVWAGDLTLPAAEPDTLASLETVAGRLGPSTQALRDAAGRFAHAPDARSKLAASAEAEQLLREAGVDPARRGAGQLYADRAPLYQETYDPDLTIHFGQAARDRLASRLAPILDLAAAAGAQAWSAAGQRFAATWPETFGDRQPRPLPEVLSRLDIHLPCPVTDTPVAHALSALALRRWNGVAEHVVLDPADLVGLLPERVGTPAILLSPDLHFDTADRELVQRGQAPAVLGELHWGLQGLGNLCCLLPSRAELTAAARGWLAGMRTELVHVATADRYGKLCYLELLPRTLELTGPATDPDSALAADEFLIAADGGVTVHGTPVALLLGDPQGRLQSPLGVPSAAWPTISFGSFTPRISVGDVVVQRATWQVPPGVLGPHEPAGLPRYLSIVDDLLRRGIPRRGFAAIDGERKPFYVDLASPHLVDLLAAEAKGRPVRLTEMLPGPEGLWQPLGGQRRVCEIRLAATERPTGDR